MSLVDLVKNAAKGYVRTIKEEFPSSTATLIAYSPIKAIAEKSAQMSDLVSIISRLAAIPVTNLEIPLLLLGRNYYHKRTRTP